MGVGRRLIDLARANLNALLDHAGRSARADLDEATEEELTAELQRRRSERAAQEMERERRLAMEAAARSRGQKRDPRPRGAGRRTAETQSRAGQIAAHYRTLGVPAGAPLEEVKKRYRALMREHHPDRHAGDAKKQKAASDKAAVITAAYAEIEVWLQKGK